MCDFTSLEEIVVRRRQMKVTVLIFLIFAPLLR